MCTLTWWRGKNGSFEVFFNRDEKKSRPPAEGPVIREEGEVRFLAPRDPAGGGTWMLANDRGVVLCLLNRWHEESGEDRAWRSRGLLVWGLAGLPEAAALGDLLRPAELVDTRPFSLWAFDATGVAGWDWDGEALSPVEKVMPVTSSSFRFEEVAAARREAFAGVNPDGPADLARFHAGIEPASASTVRMCRPDAQTMSRSEVRVTSAEVTWRYLAEQADLAGPPEENCSRLLRHSS